MRARTYPMYTHLYIYIYIITFIKEGMIFSFRNFFQKLSEFRQLPKTRVYKNIDFCLFCVYFYVNNTQDLYSFI
jgi:hypothetical protein